MKKFFTFLAVLVLIVLAFWLFRSEISNGHFSVRELSDKVVYTLSPDGTVADLKVDCTERKGEFNECGSQCESGEICAQVCAYTCEFQEDTSPTSPRLRGTGTSGEAPECGIFEEENIKCAPGDTCFTFEGSSAACSDDPCSICDKGEVCIQLESYPVQIRCIERAGVGGSDEEALVSSDPEEPVSSEDPVNEPSEDDSTVVTASENIKLTSPTPNQALNSPFTVEGEARVFENTVIVQITNNAGTILIEEIVAAHAPDVGQFGPFKISLSYDFSSTKEGWVKVFSESARDGSVENLVRVPVEFN